MTTTCEPEAPRVRHLGPSDGDPETKQWWDDHQPLVEAWLRAELRGGLQSIELGEFAASCLLRVPEARGEDWMPGEPEREPLVWDELDAYEILFQRVVHGGLWDQWDAAEFLRLIGSFAAHLGERDVIPAEEHAQLQSEYPRWAARLLEVWDRGGWYERDGAHQTQQELERSYRAGRQWG